MALSNRIYHIFLQEATWLLDVARPASSDKTSSAPGVTKEIEKEKVGTCINYLLRVMVLVYVSKLLLLE